jgi:hypothetical protein
MKRDNLKMFVKVGSFVNGRERENRGNLAADLPKTWGGAGCSHNHTFIGQSNDSVVAWINVKRADTGEVARFCAFV